MKFRNRLLVAGSLAFFAAGCAGGATGGAPRPAAASGGGAGALPPGVPLPSAAPVETGESERDDEFTRAAQDFLNRGFTAQTQGDEAAALSAFQEAVRQAELAVQADQLNPKAHILLGEAAVEAGEWTKAGNGYAFAMELRPAYIEDLKAFREQQWVKLYNAGIPFINSADYASAIEVLSAADKIYSERPEIKFILGQLYAQEGQYEEAIYAMEDARDVVNSPRIQEVDSATAANWLAGAEDINPTIAQSLLMLERYEEVVPVLQDLIAERPDEFPYVFSLADAYRELDRTDDAIGLYNEVAARPGLGAAEYLQLGIGLYQLEVYRDAAQAFMQAADVAPYDRDALELGVNSLQLEYVGNQEAEASEAEVEAWVDMAERWIDLDPNNPQSYTALAQGLSRTGDTERAPELLNAAESLTFSVRNLQMTRTRSGATIVGSVSRLKDEAPGTVSLSFSFYDAAGNVIGTQVESVELPAGQGAMANLNIDFQGEGVEGYGYSVLN